MLHLHKSKLFYFRCFNPFTLTLAAPLSPPPTLQLLIHIPVRLIIPHGLNIDSMANTVTPALVHVCSSENEVKLW